MPQPLLFQQLDDDWATVGHDHRARVAIRRWAASHPELTRYATPAGLVDDLRRRSSADADALLRHVVTIAAADQLAARTGLQALVPGLSVVVTTSRAQLPRDDAAAAAVAAAWELLRRYPIERRPRHIAANIIYAARHRLWRDGQLLRERPIDVDNLDGCIAPLHAIDDDPADSRLAAHLRHAVQRRYPVEDARLIFLSRIAGYPTDDLAARAGCTPAALRQRRRRAEQSLQAITR